jgi:hypothetical protein
LGFRMLALGHPPAASQRWDPPRRAPPGPLGFGGWGGGGWGVANPEKVRQPTRWPAGLRRPGRGTSGRAVASRLRRAGRGTSATAWPAGFAGRAEGRQLPWWSAGFAGRAEGRQPPRAAGDELCSWVTTLLAGDDICGVTRRANSSPASSTRHPSRELVTRQAPRRRAGEPRHSRRRPAGSLRRGGAVWAATVAAGRKSAARAGGVVIHRRWRGRGVG